MAIFSVGGLASGLDTTAIISKLVGLERSRSLDPLTLQRSETTGKQLAFSGFLSRVKAVQTAFEALSDPTTVTPHSATSSNTAVVTASGNSSGVNGQTSITVTRLARGSIAVAGNGKSATDATVAAGTGNFSFRLGSGTTQTVALTSTTTLADLAAGVNALNAGVNASVVNLGTSATPDYRLRLTSNDTGASNEISVLQDDTNLAVAVSQSAQNAQLTVSGFAGTIERESNTINDVVPGATLTLVTTGTATINVQTDTAALQTKLQAVVSSFNDLVGFVQNNSEVSQNTDSNDRTVSQGALAFDSTVRTVIEGLRSQIVGSTQGLGSFQRLADVGISTTKEGTLTLDTARLSTAISSNPSGVSSLLAGTGTADGVADIIADWLDGATKSGGLISTRTDALATTLTSIEDRIDAATRSVEAFQINLQATFTNLETVVSQIQSQGQFLLSALSGLR